MINLGLEMHNLAKELWPLNRSITGKGLRETLSVIRKHIPKIKIINVASGKKILDWTVPKEWVVIDAYIKTPSGKKICEFRKNNLFLLGYSSPVNKIMPLDELQKYLYSIPEKPNAIPYVTSYYKKKWGFCISEKQRKKLIKGNYHVFIKTKFINGNLTYGEIFLPGKSKKEVFLSTYICHPSMANNELSGPVVSTYIAKWLQSQKKLKYSYRIVFIPETIGSIAYISKNLKNMKKYIFAGFNVTCVGDNRCYSYLPSRNGNTLSDRIAKHILHWTDNNYKTYKWKDRGSDERQYCAPDVDLPIASIMRSKYGEYFEYHTSLDNLTKVVTPDGLEGGYNVLKKAIEAIENNVFPLTNIVGEPQLGKRGMYPTLSKGQLKEEVKLLMETITWSDGKHDLLNISEKCQCPIWKLYPIIDKLKKYKIIKFK